MVRHYSIILFLFTFYSAHCEEIELQALQLDPSFPIEKMADKKIKITTLSNAGDKQESFPVGAIDKIISKSNLQLKTSYWHNLEKNMFLLRVEHQENTQLIQTYENKFNDTELNLTRENITKYRKSCVSK